MHLRALLNDRTAINILKILYDNEVLEKSSYTMRLSQAKQKLSLAAMPVSSAELLSSAGLMAFDRVNGDCVMSITNKGKEFIEIFDQLVDLCRPQIAETRAVRIRYELTGIEKKILIIAYRIGKEAGTDFIALKTLVQELYPYDQKGKTAIVSRYIRKLEEIALVERKKDGRNTVVKLTEKGFKTIREQYLRELMR